MKISSQADIEQLNQTFTILASLSGVEILLKKHPTLSFMLNPGAKSGTDIYSCDESIVAEVFTAVDPMNNKKLEKDADRLEKTEADFRHLFYHTPSNRNVERITTLHPRITFHKLTKNQILCQSGHGLYRENAR